MEIKRLIGQVLENYLKEAGATLLIGPKFCGKTFLAEKHSNSAYYIKQKSTLNDVASYDIEHILDGKNPRLIDE